MTATTETGRRGARRTLQGTVTSTGMDKTIVVRVERTFKHAKYGKFVRRHKKYLAHDEDGTAQMADVVEIASTRPISKRKRWRLVRVVESSDFSGPPTEAESGVEAASQEAARAAEASEATGGGAS